MGYLGFKVPVQEGVQLPARAAYEPLLGRGAEFLTPSVHWEEGVLTVTTPTGCSHRVWNRRWLNDTPLCTNVYLPFYRKRLRNI